MEQHDETDNRVIELEGRVEVLEQAVEALLDADGADPLASRHEAFRQRVRQRNAERRSA